MTESTANLVLDGELLTVYIRGRKFVLRLIPLTADRMRLAMLAPAGAVVPGEAEGESLYEEARRRA